MRILIKYLLLIATGLHNGGRSNVALKSLLGLCLWAVHVAEVKNGGISIGGNTKYQTSGRWA